MTGQAPDIQLPGTAITGEANGPWEVRRGCVCWRRWRRLIKMLSTGAVLTHGSSPASIEFTEEELRAGVDEASHSRTAVAVHAHAAQEYGMPFWRARFRWNMRNISMMTSIALARQLWDISRHGYLR